METEKIYSRIVGALSGVAMGDAFGMPCEMWSQQRIRETYGVIDRLHPGHPDNEISKGLQEGEVTDDTVFTLIISQMLIDQPKRLDPLEFVKRIKTWANENAKSKNVLGPSTKRAFQEIEDGRPIEYAGRMGETNGAAMRILPIGIISDYRDMPALVVNVRAICLPTHNTSKAIGGASAVAAAVSYAIRCGGSLDDMVDVAMGAAELGSEQGYDICGPSVAKRIRYAVDYAKEIQCESAFLETIYDMVGTGLPTAQTVPAAFAVLVFAKGDPNTCARLSANLGGDTDTIGAIACGMAGAFSGIQCFDRSILDKVISVNKLDMQGIARDLMKLYF